NSRIHAAAWMPDSKRYLLASKGPLVVVDPDRKQEDVLIDKDVANLIGLAVSADGRRAVGTSQGPLLRILDLENRKGLHSRGEVDPPPRQMAFSRDGRRLLICSAFPRLKWLLLDGETGKEVLQLDGADEKLTSLAITSDGKRAALGFGDGQVRLWDLEKNRN